MIQKSTTYCSDIIYDFSTFYDQKKFTDCTIVIRDPPATIYAHRAVLANWSSFFCYNFTSGMQEDKERRIEIEFNPCNKLPEMIYFMYTEYINIDQDNIMPLIELSKHYDVESLYQGLVLKLDEVINEGNVLEFVQKCYENDLHHALSVIAKHVAKFYSSLNRKEFTNIFDIETFCAILTDAVLKYNFKDDINAEILEFMNGEQPQTQEQCKALNDLSRLSNGAHTFFRLK